MAALIQASDGNLYGTTHFGGINGGGTIFRISTSGDFATLHSFDDAGAHFPSAPLVEASDGTFYGTTTAGPLGGGGEPAAGGNW